MLSPDSQVLLLLCSHVGLEKNSDLTPLTLREWNPLARKIQASELSRPEGLLGQSVDIIKNQLDLSDQEAGRLVNLLSRKDTMDDELDRLGIEGIRVMTRTDSDYPARYRQRLKESAPPVLFYAGEPALLG